MINYGRHYRRTSYGSVNSGVGVMAIGLVNDHHPRNMITRCNGTYVWSGSSRRLDQDRRIKPFSQN